MTCRRPRSAPGSPASSAPGPASRPRRCWRCSDRPEEARVQLERVDRALVLVGGMRPARRPRAARRARRGPVRSRSPRAGGPWRRRIACPPSTASARLAVLAPVLCDAGEPARRAGRARGRARGAWPGRVAGSHPHRAGLRPAPVGRRGGRPRSARRRIRGGRRRGAVRPAQRMAAGRARCSGARSRPGRWTRRPPSRRSTPPSRAAPRSSRWPSTRSAAVREAALAAAAAAGRPEALAAARRRERRAPDRPLRERLERNPPPLEFRTLGRFEIRRGAYAVDASLLGAQGGGARGAPAADSRRRAGSRGRAARGLLARQAAGLGPARAADRDLERPRGARPALGGEHGCGSHERAYALTLRDGDRLDAGAFEAAARRALAATGPERIAALEAATRLWTGEPLPEERYSDWAASWRERLSSLHADVLGGAGRGPQPGAGITPRRLGRRGRSSTSTRSTSTPSGC